MLRRYAVLRSPQTMAQAGSQAPSTTEARCRHRSRRQKLDLAVRIAFVVLALIVLLYDKAHERAPRSEGGFFADQQAALFEVPAPPAGHRPDSAGRQTER